MDNLNQTGTNAADSAPGVDDGAARNARPQHLTKPRGRGAVWAVIAVAVVVLIGIFVARPLTHSRGDEMVTHGTTQAEIDQSHIPGAADRNEAQRP